LGLTDSARSPIAPEIPTLAESGVKGVVVTSWYGLLAPANTPTAVVEALYRDVQDILSQPAAKEQLLSLGLTPVAMRPVDFTQHLRQETSTWAKVIRERRISADQ
jgi:tripartite-type tricarboxylate transporter receptor subunit TctC